MTNVTSDPSTTQGPPQTLGVANPHVAGDVQSAFTVQPHLLVSATVGLHLVPMLFPAQFASLLHSWHVALFTPVIAQRVAPAIPVQSVSSSHPHWFAGPPTGLQSWPVLSAAQCGSVTHSTHTSVVALHRVALGMPVQSPSTSQPHVFAVPPAGLQAWPVLSAAQLLSMSHS